MEPAADAASASTADAGTPRRCLSTFDAIAITVGIVIGAFIFTAPSMVAGNSSGPAQFVTLWVLGGLVSLIGALCYAELATAYPDCGGDYYFLDRRYRRLLERHRSAVVERMRERPIGQLVEQNSTGPLRLGFGLDYSFSRFDAALDVTRTFGQNRVADNELPTDGYTMVDAIVSTGANIVALATLLGSRPPSGRSPSAPSPVSQRWPGAHSRSSSAAWRTTHEFRTMTSASRSSSVGA